MSSRFTRFALPEMPPRLLAFALVALTSSWASAQQIALDNTADGTSQLSGANYTTLNNTGTRIKALVFTTPASMPVELDTFRFALMQGTGGTQITMHADLMAVNPLTNNPTGAALASITSDVTVGTTPGYYTFDLTGSAYDNFALSPNTNYALALSVISAAAGNTNLIAYSPDVNPSSSTRFAFVGTRLSSNTGTSWSSSSVASAMTISFTQVPEPSSIVALSVAGIGLAAWGLRRRAMRA